MVHLTRLRKCSTLRLRRLCAPLLPLSVPGGPRRAARALPAPAAQRKLAERGHADALGPWPLQQLLQPLALPLALLPAALSGLQPLLRRGPAIRPRQRRGRAPRRTTWAERNAAYARVTRHRPRVARHTPRVTCHMSRVTRHGLHVTRHRPRVACHTPRVTCHTPT